MLLLRSKWWVPSIPICAWIIYEGCTNIRNHKKQLPEHLPTFIAGSLAALVFVKIDQWRKRVDFKCTKWHRLGLLLIEYIMIELFWSVCFQGLYFNTFFANPIDQKGGGIHFITGDEDVLDDDVVPVVIIIVIEMLEPSQISQWFEWSALRAWGRVSFSVYLLHMFVFYNPYVQGQPYYDCSFSVSSFRLHLRPYPTLSRSNHHNASQSRSANGLVVEFELVTLRSSGLK